MIEFKNIVLLSPSAGTHVIMFHLNDELVATYAVTVTLGDPSQLIIANSPLSSYQTAESTKLGPFAIAVADIAGNMLESSSALSHVIVATIEGPEYVCASI